MVDKKKKIVLQGYVEVQNFGDTLFAYLFYKKCIELGFDSVDFPHYKYGICQGVRDEIGYQTKKSFLACLKSDAYVMLPGNPLWSGSSGRWWHWRRRRFFRYFFMPYLFRLLNKPVYILGAGGGQNKDLWLKKQMVKFVEGASLVYFREPGTKKIFEQYGVKNSMIVTADTALIITSDMLEPFEYSVQLKNIAKEKKKLFLHIPDTSGVKEFASIVFPGVLRFLKEHQEYMVVMSEDNVHQLNETEKDVIRSTRKALIDNNIIFYEYDYHSAWQMCSLINESNVIVTEKLHVGIVGVALGKSVLAFPYHKDKVDNFFGFIGEPERSLHLSKADESKVYHQISNFHDIQMSLAPEFRQKAAENLKALEMISVI